LSRPVYAFLLKKREKNRHRRNPLRSAFAPERDGSELMHPPGLVYSFSVMAEAECLMLAAGSSTRMDNWKMMLPWGRSTIIEHSVRTALKVCTRLILVVGFRAEELIEIFEDWQQVEVVRNPDYQAGMFSSVQAGVKVVADGAFFLALADMPGVPEAVYGELLDWHARLSPAFAPAEGAYGVIPQFKGKKGHPLLLSPQMRARILRTDVSNTLRDVLAEVPTVIVPVDEPGILHDIDTPADYHSWGPGRDSR
jgi:molybdenum cofactor cytidylyltransferase